MPKGSASSIDSLTATTVEATNGTSVQSSYVPSALSIAMDRFPRSQFQSRIKRNVTNLILRSYEKEMAELLGAVSAKKQLRQLVSTLSVTTRQNGVQPHQASAAPRGTLTCATKDLNRELLCIRRFAKCDRIVIATRLVRTLDPACVTHCDIALAIFLISTL